MVSGFFLKYYNFSEINYAFQFFKLFFNISDNLTGNGSEKEIF